MSSYPNDCARLCAVSEKMPQTYVLHATGIAIVLVIILVTFLIHQWG